MAAGEHLHRKISLHTEISYEGGVDRFPRVVAKQNAAKAVASNAGRAVRARLGESVASH